jgi:hypothetical protein
MEFPGYHAAYAAAGYPARGGGNRALVWSLVIGGFLLFLGAGAGLAIIVFSGGRDRGDEQASTNTTSPKSKPRPKPREKAAPQKPPEPPPLDPQEQAKVSQAIKAGLAYLQTNQQADGTWVAPSRRFQSFRIGYFSLAGLTLLECGVSPDDPKLQKTADIIRRGFPEVQASAFGQNWGILNKTYDIALAILFLDRLKKPEDKELIQRLALRLIAGQLPTGGWNYLCPLLSPADHQKLWSVLRQNDQLGPGRDLKLEPVDENKLRVDGADSLPEALKRLAVWRDAPQDEPSKTEALRLFRVSPPADNSNTQFAILALLAARKHEVPAQRALALIAQRFRKNQRQDGSWNYRADIAILHGVQEPTMACAGLLGLAVGLGLAKDIQKNGPSPNDRRPASEDAQVKRALEVVAKFITPPGKPWRSVVSLKDMYFIWSVERVGVIFHLHEVGGTSWYGWGAEMLTANQREDGGWQHNNYAANPSDPAAPSAVVDTCFALLFLKRANLAKGLTAKLQISN